MRVLLAEVVPELLGAVLEPLEETHDGLNALAFLLFKCQSSILFIFFGTRSSFELRLKLVLDVPQILLELYAQLLGLGNADLLALVASLEASFDVHVVVLDDSEDDV